MPREEHLREKGKKKTAFFSPKPALDNASFGPENEIGFQAFFSLLDVAIRGNRGNLLLRESIQERERHLFSCVKLVLK